MTKRKISNAECWQCEERDAKIARLRTENAEMAACMELHRKHEMTYIAEWQKATGKHNMQPDYGRLLEWLHDRALHKKEA